MGKLTPEMLEKAQRAKRRQIAARERALAVESMPSLFATYMDIGGAGLRYFGRATRLAGLGIGTAIGANPLAAWAHFVPGVRDWLPDVERTPEAIRAFNKMRQQGDWDAGIEAYQDVLDAGPGFWGASEVAASFIPTGGPFVAGGRLLGAAPGLATTIAKVAPRVMRPGVEAGIRGGLTGAGRVMRAPWQAEEAVGSLALKGLGKVLGPVVGPVARPLVSRFRGVSPTTTAPDPVTGKIFHGTRHPNPESFIDENGNLVLRASENFEGKTIGVSFSESQDTALDYATRIPGAGPARARAQGAVFEIDADAIPAERLFVESGEEIVTRGAESVIIPQGKYRIIKDIAARTELEKWEARQIERVKRLSDPELADEWDGAITAGEVGEFNRVFEDPFASAAAGVSQDIVAKYGPVMPDSFPVWDEIIARVKTSSNPERTIARIVSGIPETPQGPVAMSRDMLTAKIRQGIAPTPTTALVTPGRRELPWSYTKENPDFYIQTKGTNAGKVMREPTAGSVGVKVDPEVLDANYAFYMFQNAEMQGAFKRAQRGTAIPFIGQDDIDRAMIEILAPGTTARPLAPVTPGRDILPTRVRDSILRVRQAVDEGVENYRTQGPRPAEVGGIPEREIPTSWRAGVDPQLESMGMRRRIPIEDVGIDDVQLEVAMEARADVLDELHNEMAKRGVKVPADRNAFAKTEVYGELNAAQRLLTEGGKRPRTLLYDAIARRHGGKSIADEFDILDDVAPSETGGRLDLDRLAADWDTMGQPETGIQATKDAMRVVEEAEGLLYRPSTAALVTPPVVDAPGAGGNTQRLLMNVESRAEAQANIAKEVFEPVEGSRIDEAATAYLRASKEGEEAISAAGTVAPTDPVEQYSRRITDDYNEYIRGMGPPSKDFPVSLAFVTQPMRNIGKWIRYMTDPTRMLQAIDQGVFGGALQRYVLWTTRRTDIASKHFAESHTILYRKIQDQYGMVDSLAQQLTPGIGPLRDVKRTKMLRSLAGDVLEEISSNDVNVPVGELLSRPNIARWLTKITPQEKERVVGFAQRTRGFFDDLLIKQNQARVARGQDPIGYIENYRPWVATRNIWSKIGFGKQTPAQLAANKEIPDFVTPKAWFNPRAQTRREGMVDYWKERDLQKLAGDYVETASKDIFYTNIIQNAKAYIKQMRTRKDLGGAAKGVEQWIMESYAGIKPPISKFAISVEETAGRVVRGATGGRVAGGIPIRRGMFAIRKNLTRAVFPLNWSWNLATQTASTANSFMRYGIVRTVQGLGYITNTATRREVRDNAYSVFVKRRRTGRAVYQDTGVGTMAQIERTPIEKAEDLANFITNTLEDNLTGVSTQAARREGESLGLTGRALWEYASEGGSKTQSMYNLSDMPGLLRAPEVGAVAPFQTFAFDMMNNVLEAMPFVPGGARVGAYAGVRLPSGQVVSTAMSGTARNRLKALGRWVAGITAFAITSDVALGRQPWKLSSFLPFYGFVLEGYVAGNPFNKPLPTKYAYDFTKAIQAYTKYGDWEKLRTWFIGYHALGGTQINRTIKGIEAVAEGKVTDVRGETLFDTEPPEGWESWRGGWEAWKAITQGPYAVTEGRAYKEELKGGLVEEYIGDWPRAVISSFGTWTESEEAKARRAVDRFTMTIGDVETNYSDLDKHPFVRKSVKKQLPYNLRDGVDEYMDADYDERKELIRTQAFRDIRDALAKAREPGGMLYYLRGEFLKDAPYGWRIVAASVGRTFPGSQDLREFILEWEEKGGKVPEYDYNTWSVTR